MEMDVQDFLHGCFAVGQEHVDAFAPDATAAKRRSKAMSYPKEVGSGFHIDVCQVGSVVVRNDKQMAWIDWLNIEDSDALIIAIDHAGRDAPIQDATEDTVSHGRSLMIE
jgi:hypothetical protein